MDLIFDIYEKSKYDPSVDFFRIRDIANSLLYPQLKSKQWAVEEFLKVKQNEKEEGLFWGNYYEKTLYTENDYYVTPFVDDKSDFIVMGGWYGLLANLLTPHVNNNILSIDFDPGCAEIGKKIYPNVNFLTEDVLEHFFDKPKNYGWIFNTSVEHMEKEDIDMILRLKREDAHICFQSNNYFSEPSHVNCSESLEDFVI